MTRPALRLAGATASVALLAGCLELSGPADGVASISALVLPSPSVAFGDVMRDSTGAPAPLRVTAFDADGDTVRDAEVRFVVLDRGARVDASGLVRGDSVRRDIRVVGVVGGLQTEPMRLNVVVPPTAARDSVIGPIRFARESLADSLSAPFGVIVTGTAGAPVVGWPVRFRIVRSTVVPRSATVTPVELVNDSRIRSTVDTTDDGGRGLRRLRVTPLAMDLERLRQGVVDTVYVGVSTVLGTGTAARVRDTVVALLLTPTG